MTEKKPTTIERAQKGKDNPYFLSARQPAQNKDLSWEARGVLWYLLSKPDDWKIQIADLRQGCGRDKVYGILKELKDSGYLEYVEERKQGKVIRTFYRVHETPLTEIPETVQPETEISDTVNQEGLNTTEVLESEKGTLNTENANTDYAAAKANGANGKSPSIKPLTEYQQFTQKLADICGEDMGIKSIAKKVGVNAGELWSAGYKIPDLEIFYKWWYINDWRGKKRQRPNLTNVKSLIKQATHIKAPETKPAQNTWTPPPGFVPKFLQPDFVDPAQQKEKEKKQDA